MFCSTLPWEQTKYGSIPNPKTDRAKFMNEVLPKLYEACYDKCKDAHEFVKLFHSEGRCQYLSHRHVLKLSSTVDAILSNRNPGAAGKFFDEQYVYIPSDQLILRENIQKLVKVQEGVEKEEQRSPEQPVFQVWQA